MNRRAARATLQILSTRARQRPNLGMPGQRSSATPTRSTHENERILRFQTLCRTLAGVPEWPTSISSRSAHVSFGATCFSTQPGSTLRSPTQKNRPFTFITDEESHVSYELANLHPSVRVNSMASPGKRPATVIDFSTPLAKKKTKSKLAHNWLSAFNHAGLPRDGREQRRHPARAPG